MKYYKLVGPHYLSDGSFAEEGEILSKDRLGDTPVSSKMVEVTQSGKVLGKLGADRQIPVSTIKHPDGLVPATTADRPVIVTPIDAWNALTDEQRDAAIEAYLEANPPKPTDPTPPASGEDEVTLSQIVEAAGAIMESVEDDADPRLTAGGNVKKAAIIAHLGVEDIPQASFLEYTRIK